MSATTARIRVLFNSWEGARVRRDHYARELDERKRIGFCTGHEALEAQHQGAAKAERAHLERLFLALREQLNA